MPETGSNLSERQHQRKPDWLKTNLSHGDTYQRLKKMLRGMELHTVCEEAKCPNIHECFSNRTATFMILGRTCTRACRFCAVHSGLPNELDLMEPQRVAQAVAELELQHVVITSVARDDLRDGGASIFADTIRAVREERPGCNVEVLIPDLEGSRESLSIVMEAQPDILNHNIETVRRLTPKVRSKATYDRTLRVLQMAKELDEDVLVKSGIMLGLGEERHEIEQTMDDLLAHSVDIMTIGQYLKPTSTERRHLDVERYVPPQEFLELKRVGMEKGFKHVESGPLVRSSYHAHQQVPSSL